MDVLGEPLRALLSSQMVQELEEPGSSNDPEVKRRLPFKGLVDGCSEEQLVKQSSFHNGAQTGWDFPYHVRRSPTPNT